MPRNFEEIESCRLLYSSSYRTIKALSRILLGLKISGQENVPEEGPAIVVANHRDMLDIFYYRWLSPRDTSAC